MVELLIILVLGVGHFPAFDCTEVVSKNSKSVYACDSIHKAIIEQIQTIAAHGFQMPVGWKNMGYLIPGAAPGNWVIEILEVQIPIYATICPLLGGKGGGGHNIDRCI